MDYEQAVEYIHSRKRFSHKPGLEPMQNLMKRLGNPEQKLRFVHVAGTNGKGSVTMMTASILKEAGYKVGLSISPYVVDFRERFQINGQMIAKEKLASLTEEIKSDVEAMDAWGEGEIGEFELVTAIALLWFCEEACDIVCLEVGLGGRCDATNVIPTPLVTCITKIGLDHTQILGATVSQIAAEKCGIIKKGTAVISYPLQEKAVELMIADVCNKRQASLLVPDIEDITIQKSTLFENKINYGGYDVDVFMKGKFQAFHVAMAVEAALELWRQGFVIEDEHIIDGINNTVMPARVEIIQKSPLILLDGCHNPDGVAALADLLEHAKLPRMSAVIGMLRDKAVDEMVKLLSSCFDCVYTVQLQNPRSLTAEELAQKAKPYFEHVQPMDSLSAAISAAMVENEAGKGICICGSLYLAGEARKILIPDEKH